MAFYTYSNEHYEPCTFPNGTFYGTPEEAFEVGAVYLRVRSGVPGSPEVVKSNETVGLGNL